MKDYSAWWVSVSSLLVEGNYPGVGVDERGDAL